MSIPTPVPARNSWESVQHRWVPVGDVGHMNLHPSFRRSWPVLSDMLLPEVEIKSEVPLSVVAALLRFASPRNGKVLQERASLPPGGLPGGSPHDYKHTDAEQQTSAIDGFATAFAGLGQRVGAWMHVDAREASARYLPAQAEVSLWPSEILPERITLFRGARARAAKRYAWTPRFRSAISFAALQWDAEKSWRRGASNLRHDQELFIFELTVTRQQMIDAQMLAWISTPGDYAELVFVQPDKLPAPTVAGRLGPTGRYLPAT